MNTYQIEINGRDGEIVGIVRAYGPIGAGTPPYWRLKKPGFICTGAFVLLPYSKIKRVVREALANGYTLPCSGWSDKLSADWTLHHSD